MPTGKVKFWNARKGYGFITPSDGGPDFFAHISSLMSSTDPRQDQQVSFEVEPDEKTGKPQAKRVRVHE